MELDFMSDALDDLRTDALDVLLVQYACETSAFASKLGTTPALDPEIEALASSEATRNAIAAITGELHARRMWMEQQAFAAAQFMTAMLRSARAATDRKPYIAAVGSRNKLRHTLHQTGVI
jgi:hypothetical protein